MFTVSITSYDQVSSLKINNTESLSESLSESATESASGKKLPFKRLNYYNWQLVFFKDFDALFTSVIDSNVQISFVQTNLLNSIMNWQLNRQLPTESTRGMVRNCHYNSIMKNGH